MMIVTTMIMMTMELMTVIIKLCYVMVTTDKSTEQEGCSQPVSLRDKRPAVDKYLKVSNHV